MNPVEQLGADIAVALTWVIIGVAVAVLMAAMLIASMVAL